MTWRAHRDGEMTAVPAGRHPDRKRFLDGQDVVPVVGLARLDAQDAGRRGRGVSRGSVGHWATS
jgi:hypothetical protein